MKRVLFLAYHFPPIGGAGVQRSVKFVRYLRELGWESVVVTGPGAAPGRWTPADESLAAEVPPSTTVLRIPTRSPSPSRWRRRADRWLGTQTQFARWWIEGAVEVGRRQEVDVIYASMSPYESGEVASRLARVLNKPWVADLRDPWALDEMIVYPTALHRRKALGRMRRVLSEADTVVMNTPEAAARLRRFPEFVDRPIEVITNGFDAEDFAGPTAERDDEAFRIVHAGFLHTDLGRRERSARLARRLLGGALSSVDILTRSHVFLLEAIRRLQASKPELAAQIELHLAGVLSAADLEVADDGWVNALGYLDHADTIALLRSADLLFLPMHDLPEGTRAGIVPGKTYEYLGARRPILAAVPDGDARDLLREAGSALLCRPSDVDCMRRVIEEQVERKLRGEPAATPSPEVLARYERRELTARLAEVFESVLGSESRAAAAVAASGN